MKVKKVKQKEKCLCEIKNAECSLSFLFILRELYNLIKAMEDNNTAKITLPIGCHGSRHRCKSKP